MDGKFDEQLLSTIGVDFKFRRVKIGSEEVKLQIWDTAGKVRFTQDKRPSAPLSARTTTAQTLSCSATTSPATTPSKYYILTKSLKDYWLPEAQNNNKTNAKIFVIGNKLDAKREVESYSLDSLKDSAITAFFEVLHSYLGQRQRKHQCREELYRDRESVASDQTSGQARKNWRGYATEEASSEAKGSFYLGGLIGGSKKGVLLQVNDKYVIYCLPLYLIHSCMQTRTSDSHPIFIDFIQCDWEGTAKLGITFAPGKKQKDAMTGSWTRDLEKDVERIAKYYGIKTLVSMVE